MGIYEVEFVGHKIVRVEANTKEYAEDRAIREFDGFDDFETSVEEVDEDTIFNEGC